MQYRIDAKTGKPISILGFGCMRFPRKGAAIDIDRARNMLTDAIDKGVNYLDTAYIYGGSEEALGTILTPAMREKVSIATKLPIILVKTAADFDKFFNKSLERLKTDHVEYYLIHMISNVATWERLKALGIEAWIAKQKAAGRIGSIGFSYHGGREEFPKLIDAYDWEFTQVQYNYLDEYNQAGRSGLELAAAKGMPVIVMEPLRGGKLVTGLPPKAIDAFSTLTPRQSLAAWGLRWVWDHPAVTCLLSGMSDEAQVSENIALADTALPNVLTQEQRDVFAQVVTILQEAVKVPCTACGYCLPCPKGVDIPTAFSCYNRVYAEGFTTGLNEYMKNAGVLHTDKNLASNCIGCRKCEAHCPQGIEISKEMKLVAQKLEPWWFSGATKIMRGLAKSKQRKS